MAIVARERRHAHIRNRSVLLHEASVGKRLMQGEPIERVAMQVENISRCGFKWHSCSPLLDATGRAGCCSVHRSAPAPRIGAFVQSSDMIAPFFNTASFFRSDGRRAAHENSPQAQLPQQNDMPLDANCDPRRNWCTVCPRNLSARSPRSKAQQAARPPMFRALSTARTLVLSRFPFFWHKFAVVNDGGCLRKSLPYLRNSVNWGYAFSQTRWSS